MTETRAVPFYCPYCAEEDLRPHEHESAPHGAWLCGSCRRVFALRMLGLELSRTGVLPGTTEAAPPQGSDVEGVRS
ncbi:MAG TPA: hypothetical protein VFP89_01935 [Propionibacteriaceae bacterium]|nr:hypothetical protein [Propionibacteriaceae bacterium]